MPLVLSAAFIRGKTDNQILRAVLEEYGNSFNYQPDEKEYGDDGRSTIIGPWVSRDLGFHARHALMILENRSRDRARLIRHAAAVASAFLVMLFFAAAVAYGIHKDQDRAIKAQVADCQHYADEMNDWAEQAGMAPVCPAGGE